ncbi:MAG TPA: hypothetical protein VFC73_08625 [Syntrophomonadaceae bacterium]|nr:hypothetical protein [Syntrophomonadaceae bacterium]
MRRFIKLVEKYLIRSIVLALVLLVLVQGLMTKDSMRFYMSWGERMEGQVIEYPVNTTDEKRGDLDKSVESPYGLISISADKYLSLPKAKLLINGKEVKDFTQNELQFKIMAGDVVEIDSTAYNFPIDYNVSKVSNNLSFPETGQAYTANGTIVMVGKVIVK